MKKQEEQEQETGEQMLIGINEIAKFMGQETFTVMEWKSFFQFPMTRNQEAVWVSSVEKITTWLKDRDLTIKTVNSSVLKKQHVAEMEKNRPIDPKLSKKICRTLGEVAQVFNLSAVTVVDCKTRYFDFPVPRGQGQFAIPASEFDAWFRAHPEAINKRAQW